MSLPRPSRRRAPRASAAPALVPPPPLRPPGAAFWWISLAVLLVGGAVGGTLWWLLADLTTQALPAPSAPGQPAGAGSARGEMLRTALAAGAAVGAGITLALAFRRQHHQELSAAHTTHDATERRVTDLYTKAVEQLGHEQAAVRLGGLYALERVAQDNPGHRQTIVNVICAYLRMPYTPPSPPDLEQERREALRRAIETALLVVPANDIPSAAGADPEGERQVRLTAQTILTDHLRDNRTPGQRKTAQPPVFRFWEEMNIDLTGATLMDFDFNHCHAAQARFGEAAFTGTAGFDGATFTGDAGFGGATFTGDAWFNGATFTGDAGFHRAAFNRDAGFHRAAFNRDAGFREATFTGHAGFREATFTEQAVFDGAAFTRDAEFREAAFNRDAGFHRATFNGAAWFRRATFTGEAWFDGATFTGTAGFHRTTFTGDAWFREATFTGHAGFHGATFRQPPHWPEGWRLEVGWAEARLVEADKPASEAADGP